MKIMVDQDFEDREDHMPEVIFYLSGICPGLGSILFVVARGSKQS